MIKTIKKSRMIIISILLIIVCGFVYCSTNFLRTKQTIEFQTMVKNIEISKNEIDYQSILDEFEDSKLETKGSQTTFVGYKSINLNELDGFDLVSDSDVEDTEVSVKYNFSYDNETNIVTLSAELQDELGVIYVDTLTGSAFINEDGAIFAATIGMSAIEAGTAFAEILADGVEAIIDKGGELLEILYKGTRYAAEILTATTIETLAKDAYFIALADTRSGTMYYTPIAIPKSTAISIVNHNSLVSVYTVKPNNARSVAQQAGNNISPVFDVHHGFGYFDHYHRGDIPHDMARSHVFFCLPQFN